MTNHANRFGAATDCRSSHNLLREPVPPPVSKRLVSLVELLRSIQVLLDRAIEETGRVEMISPSSAPSAAGSLTPPEKSGREGIVATVVDHLLSAKDADGASSRYRETIRSHLGRFAACFQARFCAWSGPILILSAASSRSPPKKPKPRPGAWFQSRIICFFGYSVIAIQPVDCLT